MSSDRREFVKGIAAVMLSTGAVAASARESAAEVVQKQHGQHPSSRSRKLNVIVMICDDLASGDIGCYGSSLPTPNLDKLASEGTRFVHCNAGHPICSASRAALLTGRYAPRSGTPGALFPNSPIGMSTDETTLADLFRNKGYKTHCIGKWHLGDAPEFMPSNRGFETFYGVPYSDDMAPLPLMHNLDVLETEVNRDNLTQLYTKDATRFIEENADHPFFMYIGYSYPHDPAAASKDFKGKSGFGDYGDSVMEIDWSVGQIARQLEKSHLTNDTLVLFTSDHGPWYLGNPGNLRGRKASTFEGGFRVPLLARCPGLIQRGKVAEAWISNMDILPTAVSLCGLDMPSKPVDGVDISNVLIHATAAPSRKPVLYFYPMSDGGNALHCIRREEWKLRVSQATGGEIYLNDGSTFARTSAWLPYAELYNLHNDPQESYDVADAHPEIVKELLASMEEQLQTFPPSVVQAYAKLKQNVGDKTTPTGASPRPPMKRPLPVRLWVPRSRQ